MLKQNAKALGAERGGEQGPEPTGAPPSECVMMRVGEGGGEGWGGPEGVGVCILPPLVCERVCVWGE